MASNKLTYSKSGVNIPKADSFVKFISSLARKSSKSGDFKNIGGFGAISPIPKQLKILTLLLVLMELEQKLRLQMILINLIQLE